MTTGDRVRQGIRRGLDAGASLSKMSRRELEEALHGALTDLAPAKERLDDVLEEIRARTSRGAGLFGDMVRDGLPRDLESVAARGRSDLADLFDRASSMFGDLLGRERPAGESAAAPKKAAPKKAAPKKAAPKKAAPKKAAPRKAVPTKAAPKKAAPKKAAPKKAAPKRAAPRKAGSS